MDKLLERLEYSVKHLKILDKVFSAECDIYKEINNKLNSIEFKSTFIEISKEMYAGGKKSRGKNIINRQMILGDIIEYIFTGRAYYFASKSEDKLKKFYKLVFYCVNQLLILDSITVNPDLRKKYIEELQQYEYIPKEILFEKDGDIDLANELKTKNYKIQTEDFKKYDDFVDSILPKTLGTPKELIVFIELIRLKIGIIIPLLLTQRIFGEKNPIAPPDILLMKSNKDIFGIEIGYKKELQSKEFSIRTSIPTFAVDLENNLHNRCPICGEFILYCDVFIEKHINDEIDDQTKILCNGCKFFDEGNCIFSNYYGKVNTKSFSGKELKGLQRHYHTKCVIDKTYTNRNKEVKIFEKHKDEFFAQIPRIEGIQNLK